MPCFKTASVSDNADVFRRARSRCKILLQLPLRIVPLIIEVGFDLDDDVAIQGVNPSAQFSNFEFVFKFYFDRINSESLAEKIQEQMSARVVMSIGANRLAHLLTIIFEQSRKFWRVWQNCR